MLVLLNVDVSKELAFYGAYHNNFENQVIHIICVPLIFWSALVLVGLGTQARLLPLLVTTFYASYYIFLDLYVGFLSACLYLFLWKIADDFILSHQTTRLTGASWAILAQVIGWGLQVFVGHAIYEGRKPALLDSLTQAFSLAPLFVVYETLWMIFPGFQHELHMNVHHLIAQIHDSWQIS